MSRSAAALRLRAGRRVGQKGPAVGRLRSCCGVHREPPPPAHGSEGAPDLAPAANVVTVPDVDWIDSPSTGVSDVRHAVSNARYIFRMHRRGSENVVPHRTDLNRLVPPGCARIGDLGIARSIRNLQRARTPHRPTAGQPPAGCLQADWAPRGGIRQKGEAGSSKNEPRVPGSIRTASLANRPALVPSQATQMCSLLADRGMRNRSKLSVQRLGRREWADLRVEPSPSSDVSCLYLLLRAQVDCGTQNARQEEGCKPDNCLEPLLRESHIEGRYILPLRPQFYRRMSQIALSETKPSRHRYSPSSTEMHLQSLLRTSAFLRCIVARRSASASLARLAASTCRARSCSANRSSRSSWLITGSSSRATGSSGNRSGAFPVTTASTVSSVVSASAPADTATPAAIAPEKTVSQIPLPRCAFCLPPALARACLLCQLPAHFIGLSPSLFGMFGSAPPAINAFTTSTGLS